MATGSQLPFKVEGKRAWISGAGSGINYHFAKQLLERNCSVLIADLALRPEARELIAKYASGTPKAVFHQTDVSDWTQLQASFAAAKQAFGGLDIVAPGAGVYEEHWSNFWYPPGSPETRDTLQSSRYKILDINLTHPIRAAQMAISEFLNPDAGTKDKASPANPKRILLTSSIASQIFGIPYPLYFASKHAISGFSRSLGGLEEPLGIRVNCVAPGIVKTPLWLEHPEKLKIFDESTDTWVTPEECAEQMIRLLEDPELVGGTILEVAHGSSRIVPPFMNPGPSGLGLSTSQGKIAGIETLQQVSKPAWGKI